MKIQVLHLNYYYPIRMSISYMALGLTRHAVTILNDTFYCYLESITLFSFKLCCNGITLDIFHI